MKRLDKKVVDNFYDDEPGCKTNKNPFTQGVFDFAIGLAIIKTQD
jgi:hypothetical protein